MYRLATCTAKLHMIDTVHELSPYPESVWSCSAYGWMYKQVKWQISLWAMTLCAREKRSALDAVLVY